jgi:hypothetical protein
LNCGRRSRPQAESTIGRLEGLLFHVQGALVVHDQAVEREAEVVLDLVFHQQRGEIDRGYARHRGCLGRGQPQVLEVVKEVHGGGVDLRAGKRDQPPTLHLEPCGLPQQSVGADRDDLFTHGLCLFPLVEP